MIFAQEQSQISNHTTTASILTKKKLTLRKVQKMNLKPTTSNQSKTTIISIWISLFLKKKLKTTVVLTVLQTIQLSGTLINKRAQLEAYFTEHMPSHARTEMGHLNKTKQRDTQSCFSSSAKRSTIASQGTQTVSCKSYKTKTLNFGKKSNNTKKPKLDTAHSMNSSLRITALPCGMKWWIGPNRSDFQWQVQPHIKAKIKIIKSVIRTFFIKIKKNICLLPYQSNQSVIIMSTVPFIMFIV